MPGGAGLSCALLGPVRPAGPAVAGGEMLVQWLLAPGWFCGVLYHSLGKKIILLASWLHPAVVVLCVSMSCWLRAVLERRPVLWLQLPLVGKRP